MFEGIATEKENIGKHKEDCTKMYFGYISQQSSVKQHITFGKCKSVFFNPLNLPCFSNVQRKQIMKVDVAFPIEKVTYLSLKKAQHAVESFWHSHQKINLCRKQLFCSSTDK